MQTTTDTAVVAVREMAPRNPTGALNRALELARDSANPTGRIRAFAVAMTALGILGNHEEALAVYEDARAGAGRASRMAMAELELEAATIHLAGGDSEKASAHLAVARGHLAAALAQASGNRSEGGLRRLRWLHVIEATAEWLAGAIALRHGDPNRAHRAGLAMAKTSDAKSVQCSAVALVAAAAFALPGASDEHLHGVLGMVERTEAKLTRSDPPVHRLKLHWIRAGVLGRLGELEEAERILERVVGLLRKHDYRRDAEKAEQDLRWVRDKLREKVGYAFG